MSLCVGCRRVAREGARCVRSCLAKARGFTTLRLAAHSESDIKKTRVFPTAHAHDCSASA